MKKLFSFITFLMVFSICLSSCSKDNESSSLNGASILGTWKMTWDEKNEEGYILVTFSSNGSGIQEDWYRKKGGGEYILDEVFSFTYKYNSSKKELIGTNEDGEIVTSYCEVTDSRMIMRWTDYDGEERTDVYVRQ